MYKFKGGGYNLYTIQRENVASWILRQRGEDHYAGRRMGRNLYQCGLGIFSR